MKGWKDHEPSPIEFMHHMIMHSFHKYRDEIGGSVNVEINGSILTNIVAQAKRATYEKYKALNLEEPVLKEKLK